MVMVAMDSDIFLRVYLAKSIGVVPEFSVEAVFVAHVLRLPLFDVLDSATHGPVFALCKFVM